MWRAPTCAGDLGSGGRAGWRHRPRLLLRARAGRAGPGKGVRARASGCTASGWHVMDPGCLQARRGSCWGIGDDVLQQSGHAGVPCQPHGTCAVRTACRPLSPAPMATCLARGDDGGGGEGAQATAAGVHPAGAGVGQALCTGRAGQRGCCARAKSLPASASLVMLSKGHAGLVGPFGFSRKRGLLCPATHKVSVGRATTAFC